MNPLRALSRWAVGVNHWALLVLIVAVCLGLSYLGHGVIEGLDLELEQVKAASAWFGYVGGLLAFLPVFMAAALDYKKRRIDAMVAGTAPGAGRDRLISRGVVDDQARDRLRAWIEFLNPLGFLLITVGFLLSI